MKRIIKVKIPMIAGIIIFAGIILVVINGITDTRSDLYGNPILYILAGLMLQVAIVTISKIYRF
jgi:hypothetical protein